MIKRILSSTFAICLVWGIAFGALEAAYFTRANQVYPVGWGHLVLALATGAVHSVLAIGAAVILGRLFRTGPAAGVTRALAGPWFLTTLLAISHYRDRVNTRPRSLEGTLVTVAIVAGMVLLFWALRRLLSDRESASRAGVGWVGALTAVAGGVWLATARPETAPPPDEVVTAEMVGGADDTGLRVLLVGLDGGVWSILDRLIEEGRLPNTARLVARGITADLQTDLPTYSPILWTSIATGKHAIKHGIHGFVRTHPPFGLPEIPVGTKRVRGLTKVVEKGIAWWELFDRMDVSLYTSTDWRARPIWDILGEFGMRSVVLEWYVSHPAQPIRGVLATDKLHLLKDVEARARHEGPESDLGVDLNQLAGDESVKEMVDEERRKLVYPPQLADAFAKTVIAAWEIPDDALFALVDTTGMDGAAREAFKKRFAAWFEVVRANLARDRSTQALARVAFPAVPDWRFGGVYFRAMDALHHETWRYKDLPGEDLDEHPERRLRTAIDRYYEICDEILGDVLRQADERTVVIVLSDHGFEARYDHERGPSGFLIMAGGPVRHSIRRQAASIYDIAPTVLALLGVPVPRDMDGRVLESMIEPAFWKAHPIRHAPSYERDRELAGHGDATAMDERELEHLRALGYIR